MSLFSIFGLWIRLFILHVLSFGLIHYLIQTDNSIIPLICVQIIGCFLMGAISKTKGKIAAFDHSLVIALSTALCGIFLN
jgi:hypothetical protein